MTDFSNYRLPLSDLNLPRGWYAEWDAREFMPREYFVFEEPLAFDVVSVFPPKTWLTKQLVASRWQEDAIVEPQEHSQWPLALRRVEEWAVRHGVTSKLWDSAYFVWTDPEFCSSKEDAQERQYGMFYKDARLLYCPESRTSWLGRGGWVDVLLLAPDNEGGQS